MDKRISWFFVPGDERLEEPERKLFAKAAEQLGTFDHPSVLAFTPVPRPA